jgi:uncharacterized protein Yka (UPF0111/DUF47 family)
MPTDTKRHTSNHAKTASYLRKLVSHAETIAHQGRQALRELDAMGLTEPDLAKVQRKVNAIESRSEQMLRQIGMGIRHG